MTSTYPSPVTTVAESWMTCQFQVRAWRALETGTARSADGRRLTDCHEEGLYAAVTTARDAGADLRTVSTGEQDHDVVTVQVRTRTGLWRNLVSVRADGIYFAPQGARPVISYCVVPGMHRRIRAA